MFYIISMAFDKKRALKMIAQQNKEIIDEFEREYPDCRDVIESAAKACITNFWYLEGGVRTTYNVETKDEIGTDEIERYINALGFRLTHKVEYEYDSTDKETPYSFIIRFNIN